MVLKIMLIILRNSSGLPYYILVIHILHISFFLQLPTLRQTLTFIHTFQDFPMTPPQAQSMSKGKHFTLPPNVCHLVVKPVPADIRVKE